MKKLLLVFVLLLTLFGCGKSGGNEGGTKKPEETAKILSDLSVLTLVDYTTDNYYDEDVKCYDMNERPTECALVTMEPSKIPYASSTLSGGLLIVGATDENGYYGLVASYYLTDTTFRYRFVDYEGKKLFEMYSTKCVYTIDGQQFADEEQCTGDDLAAAKDYMDRIEKQFKAIGLTKEDLYEYYKWYTAEKMPAVTEAVMNMYEKDKQ